MAYLISDHRRHILEESPCEARYAICNLCNDKVPFKSYAYYCRKCESNFHKDCLTITYAKTHEHTLTFIRRKISFLCDVCGVSPNSLNMYGCLQCDFFVHRQCIYLPQVIKITRHSHRLFRILRLSDGDNICGVCRKRVVVEFGGYSCIDKTCNYVIHSYCLISFIVWDGKDLQGEPEPEKIDSEADLKEIDGKSKRHFSHDHDLLRLDVDGQEESEQICQACILPIEFGSFLGCKQCHFSLQDVCASLPRKMEHAIHIHPLTMHVDTMSIENGFFTCSVCNQNSCGFMYKCCQENCRFKMDVKCASFAEPFKHRVHRHPFHLAIFYNQFNYRCVCCYQRSRYAAKCNECFFLLEFKCVNLPELVKYKCDTHPLTLYCDRDNRRTIVEPLEWWCEICENYINKDLIVYTCHDCCTTLHVECILGKYPYFKSGHSIKVSGCEVEIASNKGVSRPICHTCHRVCQDRQLFKGRDDACFCSIECIRSTN